MLDLTDPNILIAYHSVIENEPLNWFLLKYVEASDVLTLCAHGTQGLPEMRDQIESLEDVFFGFCREIFDGQARYVLINYIPEWISSTRTDTIMSHSRHIASLLEAEEATLTVHKADDLTLGLLREALVAPSPTTRHHPTQVDRSFSLTDKALPRNPNDDQVRRTVSESTPPTPSPSKAGGLLSRFLRGKKHDTHSTPPPIPPKDRDGRGVSNTETQPSAENTRRTRTNSLSEFGAYWKIERKPDDIVVISPQPPRVPAQLQSAHLRAKWASESLTAPLDPAEKARRRGEAQRQRELEEQQAIKEEEERQARMKREKAEQYRRELEEEERRKEVLEQELRYAAFERQRKEREAREAEERRMRELQERRRADKERRMEESRRLEEWRREQQWQADEAAQRKEELRRQAEEDRLTRIRGVEAELQRRGGADDLMKGWVTVQTNESLRWRRRFFTFSGSTLMFYRNPQETGVPLDSLELHGRVNGLKEWNEGYEDLEAIPHSFAVEFKDGQGAWSMYSDSAEEKIELLGFLYQAARL